MCVLPITILYALVMLVLNLQFKSLMFLTLMRVFFFFFQAEDGIRDKLVTGVQTYALPISWHTRLAQFGLTLHPDKTRLLEFGRHAADARQHRGEGKPETFDFLGFTHYCGKFRSGRFLVRRQTMRTRLRRKLQAVKAELRRRRHDPVPEVGQWVRRVVLGHFTYYGVPGNDARLEQFRAAVMQLWYRALRRRGQRHPLPWARLGRVVARWIPSVRIVHPYPEVRFAVRHPR